MPTEPTPNDPNSASSTATDRIAHDRTADATGGTEPEEHASGPSGASESVSDADRDATDRDATDPDADRIAELERRVTELEAELDAVRGLLDGVEAVDERVERRASAALAKAETLEERFAPEAGVVRKRLPDTDGDGSCEAAEGDGTDRRRDGRRTPEPDPGAGSRIPSESDHDPGGGGDSADSPESDALGATGTVRNGRTDPADANAIDGGSAGTGAISSVGSGAPDDGRATGADGDADRSLAVRLRDAFR